MSRFPAVRRLRPPLAVLAVLAPTLLLAPAADAGTSVLAVGTDVTAERALLARDDGQRLVLSLGVEARSRPAGSRPVVLVPVPGPSTVASLPVAQADVLTQLDRATRSRPEPPPKAGRASADPPRVGEDVLQGAPVTGVQTATTDDPDAGLVHGWLVAAGGPAATGGYPSAAVHDVVAAYRRDGWSFVALRLPANAGTGVVGPIVVRSRTSGLAYPQRLNTVTPGASSLRLSVVGPHRVGTTGLDVAQAGLVSALRPAPTSDVRAALLGGRFLTVLVRPTVPRRGAGDARLTRYVSDTTYPYHGSDRATDVFQSGGVQAPPSRGAKYDGPPGWLWVAVLAAVAAGVAGLGLVLRARGRRPG